MSASSRRFLFLVRHSPLAGARFRETLDMIFTVAAFDQWVTVLFLDDGVFQLVAPLGEHSASDLLWGPMLKAMDFYDIHEILVDEQSLRLRGLTASDLVIGAALVAPEHFRTLLGQHDRLVVC